MAMTERVDQEKDKKNAKIPSSSSKGQNDRRSNHGRSKGSDKKHGRSNSKSRASSKSRTKSRSRSRSPKRSKKVSRSPARRSRGSQRKSSRSPKRSAPRSHRDNTAAAPSPRLSTRQQAPAWVSGLRTDAEVIECLSQLYSDGKLKSSDLEAAVAHFLESLQAGGALAVIREFASLDLQRIRNLTAFFIGICKRVANKQPPPPGRPVREEDEAIIAPPPARGSARGRSRSPKPVLRQTYNLSRPQRNVSPPPPPPPPPARRRPGSTRQVDRSPPGLGATPIRGLRNAEPQFGVREQLSARGPVDVGPGIGGGGGGTVSGPPALDNSLLPPGWQSRSVAANPRPNSNTYEELPGPPPLPAAAHLLPSFGAQPLIGKLPSRALFEAGSAPVNLDPAMFRQPVTNEPQPNGQYSGAHLAPHFTTESPRTLEDPRRRVDELRMGQHHNLSHHSGPISAAPTVPGHTDDLAFPPGWSAPHSEATGISPNVPSSEPFAYQLSSHAQHTHTSQPQPQYQHTQPMQHMQEPSARQIDHTAVNRQVDYPAAGRETDFTMGSRQTDYTVPGRQPDYTAAGQGGQMDFAASGRQMDYSAADTSRQTDYIATGRQMDYTPTARQTDYAPAGGRQADISSAGNTWHGTHSESPQPAAHHADPRLSGHLLSPASAPPAVSGGSWQAPAHAPEGMQGTEGAWWPTNNVASTTSVPALENMRGTMYYDLPPHTARLGNQPEVAPRQLFAASTAASTAESSLFDSHNLIDTKTLTMAGATLPQDTTSKGSNNGKPNTPKGGASDGQGGGAAPINESGAGAQHSETSLLRYMVADYVKEVLKPVWRANKLTRDEFKAIAKRTVELTLAAIPAGMSEYEYDKPDELEGFMSDARKDQIRAMVEESVEKYERSKQVPAAV